MEHLLSHYLLAMNFGQRLVTLRKAKQLTQAKLAERIGCHISMIRRYEANETQPTLEVIRNMAMALNVSADMLVFEEGDRDINNNKLKLLFEAIERLDEQEQHIIGELLEGMVSKYEANRFNKVS